MRIGILTFHRSLNNGAFIQCYSLYIRLKQEYPTAEIEVIDYTSPKIEALYPLNLYQYFHSYTSSPRAFASRLKCYFLDPKIIRRNREKKDAFESCYKYIKMSDKHFYHEPISELFDYIDSRYDIVIAGSDAIWNYSLRGFPNPYFLDDSIKIPKFSYAASCFGMNYESIPETERTAIRKILDTYHFIGVRDDESAKFLTTIGCTHSFVHTCDPTVFLDVNSLPVDESKLRIKLGNVGFSFERKTIGVMGTNEMCRFIKKTYGDEYQIISLFNYCKDADVNLYHISPFEWAYIFRYFKITITTYFHGTLLSLRNGTPVICIALENDYTNKHESKVEDFLKRVNMNDSYIYWSKKNEEQFKKKIETIIYEDCSEIIIEKMNKEALTSQSFFEALRSNTSYKL